MGSGAVASYIKGRDRMVADPFAEVHHEKVVILSVCILGLLNLQWIPHI